MRIQHNIAALNANRQLGINNSNVSKNLEKLSSGYKINRAGDDAAGLAISEKMRGQIRGLDQATNNANDGISLVQTAEGALNETTSILQRMKELATQASNGTYKNEVDRENIAKEVEALQKEINRISTSTNFNKISLLDGTLGSYEVTASYDAEKGIAAATMKGGKLEENDEVSVTFDKDTKKLTVTSTEVKVTFDAVDTAKDGQTYTFVAKVASDASDEVKAKYDGLEVSLTLGSAINSATANVTTDVTVSKVNPALTLQIGATASPDQQVSLSIGDMSSKGLGVDTISVKDQESALESIEVISQAIDKVSGTRADLGALQNRLEHTVNNLGVTSENLSSAESRIRDVDMAKEMMEMTKNNVLAQAAQSMLAQANQQPQNVLKLLQ